MLIFPLVCVRPSRKPELMVFSRTGSNEFLSWFNEVQQVYCHVGRQSYFFRGLMRFNKFTVMLGDNHISFAV